MGTKVAQENTVDLREQYRQGLCIPYFCGNTEGVSDSESRTVQDAILTICKSDYLATTAQLRTLH
jgi:hypothetical protein